MKQYPQICGNLISRQRYSVLNVTNHIKSHFRFWVCSPIKSLPTPYKIPFSLSTFKVYFSQTINNNVIQYFYRYLLKIWRFPVLFIEAFICRIAQQYKFEKCRFQWYVNVYFTGYYLFCYKYVERKMKFLLPRLLVPVDNNIIGCKEISFFVSFEVNVFWWLSHIFHKCSNVKAN